MKKLLFVILVMSLTVGLLMAQTEVFSSRTYADTSRNSFEGNVGIVENVERHVEESTIPRRQNVDTILSENFDGAAFPPTGWVRHTTITGAEVDARQWHRQTGAFNDVPPFGTAMAVSRSWHPATGGFTPNNWLVTPQVSLPADSEIILSFQVRPEVDTSPVPAWGADKYSVYVSTVGNQMADFTNEVFTQTFSIPYGLPSPFWQLKEIDLSSFAGQNVWIAIRHWDCFDHSAVIIDNFLLTASEGGGGGGDGLPPVNLEATVVGSTVNLTWDPPGSGQWISHMQQNNMANHIGVNDPATMRKGHRFTQAQLESMGVAGGQLTTVAFTPRYLASITSNTIQIFTGGSGGTAPPFNEGTLVHSQLVTQPLIEGWVEVELNTAVPIPTTGELWIVIQYVVTSSVPMGADEGPAFNGFGNLIHLAPDPWNTLQNVAPSLTYNWAIRGWAEGSSGRVMLSQMSEAQPEIETPITPTVSSYELSNVPTGGVILSLPPSKESGRNLLGYNVRRGTTLLTPSPITETSYSAANTPSGFHLFHVTAVYADGESDPITVEVEVVDGFRWSENFDSTTFPPTGWTMIDADGDGRNWIRWTSTNHNGSPGSAASESSYSDGTNWFPLTPDNYLITHSIALPPNVGGADLTLSFYVGTPSPDYASDTYSVLISTTTPTIGNFQVLHTETLTSATAPWSQRLITLENYAEETVYLAFRHYNSVDMHLVRIDDMMISLVSVDNITNPPENFTATGGMNSVTLTWEPPLGDRVPVQYRIYKGTEIIATLPSSVLTFTENLLVNGIPIEYQADAVYELPQGWSEKTPVAIGIPVGDTIFPFMPRNLNGDQLDANVTLTWDEPTYFIPIPDGAGAFFHPWPDQRYTGIGQSQLHTIGKAQRFSPSHLQGFGIGAGWRLVGVDWWGGSSGSAGAAYTVQIFTGGTSMTEHGTMVHEQFWGITDASTVDTNIETGLTNWVDIPQGQELRIRIMAVALGGTFSICYGMDPDQAVPEYGNLAFINNNYNQVNLVPGLETVIGNAMIAGWVMSPSGQIVRLGGNENDPLPQYIQDMLNSNKRTDISTLSVMPSSIEEQTVTRGTRNFLHYNVYMDDVPVAQNVTGTTHTIMDIIDGGFRKFGVSAYYSPVVPGANNESEKVEMTMNVIPRQFITDFPHFEGFNNPNIPTGWLVFNQSPENRNWAISATGGLFERCAVSFSMIGNNAQNPDNWLVSPRVVIPEDEDKFYMVYNVGASHPERYLERYDVLISETNADITSFVSVFSEVLTTDEWEERILDLSAYIGKTIMVAFRHHGVSGQSSLKLDELYFNGVISDADKDLPAMRTELLVNYPNPFNPETIIGFNLRNEGMVSIDIFNIRGQRVRTLVNDVFEAGRHEVIWNGQDDNGRGLSSGVYFYRMNADGVSSTRRMVLMK
ncbi:MAG: choice-of-anchor J domain-containing protein [Candidatus Cloacimonetes bacterium]|nr:choice-of-anchor J domain-containing protein [Candidatus Cloacimonadota bacterium]